MHPRALPTTVYLNGVGTAKARNTVTVRAQVAGRIMSLKFKDGTGRKRGDAWLIDPATYRAQLEQAIARGTRRGAAGPTPSATSSATRN